MIEERKISRRKVITGIGAGIAAAAISPAFAVNGGSAERSFSLALDDPRGKYPKPPFKAQFQPWPGLASINGPCT